MRWLLTEPSTELFVLPIPMEIGIELFFSSMLHGNQPPFHLSTVPSINNIQSGLIEQETQEMIPFFFLAFLHLFRPHEDRCNRRIQTFFWASWCESVRFSGTIAYVCETFKHPSFVTWLQFIKKEKRLGGLFFLSYAA